MNRPLVYIASPYTKGDPAINTHFQCKIFNQIMDDGIVWAYIPLWSHMQHLIYPRHYQDWIDYDLAIIDKCDACLRLTAELPDLKYSQSESSGADNEVKVFLSQNKPVFHQLDDCYSWARAKELVWNIVKNASSFVAKPLS